MFNNKEFDIDLCENNYTKLITFFIDLLHGRTLASPVINIMST